MGLFLDDTAGAIAAVAIAAVAGGGLPTLVVVVVAVVVAGVDVDAGGPDVELGLGTAARLLVAATYTWLLAFGGWGIVSTASFACNFGHSVARAQKAKAES